MLALIYPVCGYLASLVHPDHSLQCGTLFSRQVSRGGRNSWILSFLCVCVSSRCQSFCRRGKATNCSPANNLDYIVGQHRDVQSRGKSISNFTPIWPQREDPCKLTHLLTFHKVHSLRCNWYVGREDMAFQSRHVHSSLMKSFNIIYRI